jgi:hypothetical protein
MRDGMIVTMPAKRSRRLVLLDHVAGRFDVGVRYAESEVNFRLRALHEDYAALRRYLVDEGFLSREHGEYWRTGGSVASEGADTGGDTERADTERAGDEGSAG